MVSTLKSLRKRGRVLQNIYITLKSPSVTESELTESITHNEIINFMKNNGVLHR